MSIIFLLANDPRNGKATIATRPATKAFRVFWPSVAGCRLALFNIVLGLNWVERDDFAMS
ncbi:hypothetical protein K439DRAFT_1628927 [Ramaria rubella]|nr:hypothetical protein K439DRAFT_1628927 [Ramaria rubella]